MTEKGLSHKNQDSLGKGGVSGEFACQGEPQGPQKPCPECGSLKLYKDGMRYTDQGPVQRRLCRNCGYRFSEKRPQVSSGPLQKISNGHLKAPSNIPSRRQIWATLMVGGAKNLDATELKTVAGEIKDPSIKGRILEYLVHLNNEAKKPDTLKAHRKVLTRLAKHGANLLDPESVKQTIANEKVQDSTKAHYIGVYTVFADYCRLSWKPPVYKYTRKLPFIPLESEIDQLIAGFKKRTATFLQVLKETGARCGEAWALKWTDLNGNILTINAPEKGSLPRQHKISEKLVSMLQSLPQKDPRIFGPYMSLSNFRNGFMRKRRSISRNLSNPRLDEITFHTFRHFYATMLYAKTKNIILVQQKLGHRSIENTQIYTQLIVFESDEYHSATATRTDEAEKLVQAGFEYVCTTTENIMLFRKRK